MTHSSSWTPKSASRLQPPLSDFFEVKPLEPFTPLPSSTNRSVELACPPQSYFLKGAACGMLPAERSSNVRHKMSAEAQELWPFAPPAPPVVPAPLVPKAPRAVFAPPLVVPALPPAPAPTAFAPPPAPPATAALPAELPLLPAAGVDLLFWSPPPALQAVNRAATANTQQLARAGQGPRETCNSRCEVRLIKVAVAS